MTRIGTPDTLFDTLLLSLMLVKMEGEMMLKMLEKTSGNVGGQTVLASKRTDEINKGLYLSYHKHK